MPVNIQLNDENFSLGPSSGFFYSCSFSLQSLLQVEADGTVVGTFPVGNSTFRTPIKQLHYDGTFFWTLEDLPSSLGIVIKRWRLTPIKTVFFPNVSPSEFTWQDEFTLLDSAGIVWEANAFAVEHYHRQLDGSFLQGVNTVRLNDVSNIELGTPLYLGPSSFAGFIGNEEKIVVTGINTTTRDITFFKGGGLENSYISQDPVDFSPHFYVFNNNGFGGTSNGRGTLVKFSYPKKLQVRSDTGFKYGFVNAADFDNTLLSWIKVFQLFELDVAAAGFDLNTSQEANLVESDKITPITVFDMVADLSNTQYLKLQDRETTEDLSTGLLTTTNFGGLYNFQTHATPSFVNSIALDFDTRFTRPIGSSDTIDITARVRDQYNFAVFNKSIQFTAAISSLSDPGVPGTFSPGIVVTNISGVAETVYTPSVTPGNIIIDITADVL